MLNIAANWVLFSFEPIAATEAEEALQGLVFVNFSFVEVAVDVDHVGSAMQVGKIIDLIAFLFA